jgi:hypothetical protein
MAKKVYSSKKEADQAAAAAKLRENAKADKEKAAGAKFEQEAFQAQAKKEAPFKELQAQGSALAMRTIGTTTRQFGGEHIILPHPNPSFRPTWHGGPSLIAVPKDQVTTTTKRGKPVHQVTSYDNVFPVEIPRREQGIREDAPAAPAPAVAPRRRLPSQTVGVVRPGGVVGAGPRRVSRSEAGLGATVPVTGRSTVRTSAESRAEGHYEGALSVVKNADSRAEEFDSTNAPGTSRPITSGGGVVGGPRLPDHEIISNITGLSGANKTKEDHIAHLTKSYVNQGFPLAANNNPVEGMSDEQRSDFLKNRAFKSAGVPVKAPSEGVDLDAAEAVRRSARDNVLGSLKGTEDEQNARYAEASKPRGANVPKVPNIGMSGEVLSDGGDTVPLDWGKQVLQAGVDRQRRKIGLPSVAESKRRRTGPGAYSPLGGPRSVDSDIVLSRNEHGHPLVSIPKGMEIAQKGEPTNKIASPVYLQARPGHAGIEYKTDENGRMVTEGPTIGGQPHPLLSFPVVDRNAGRFAGREELRAKMAGQKTERDASMNDAALKADEERGKEWRRGYKRAAKKVENREELANLAVSVESEFTEPIHHIATEANQGSPETEKVNPYIEYMRRGGL